MIEIQYDTTFRQITFRHSDILMGVSERSLDANRTLEEAHRELRRYGAPRNGVLYVPVNLATNSAFQTILDELNIDNVS